MQCYGTLLYRKSGDILHALSGELKVKRKSETAVRKELNVSISESAYHGQPLQDIISTDTIISVCQYLNKVLNRNIKQIVEKYHSNTNLYSKFTFQGFTESIDDILMKAVVSLTTCTRKTENFS